MAKPIAPVLDRSNAQVFRANPDFNKQAVLTWNPARYKLSWGEQMFDGPHMAVDGDTNEPYGCALEEFFTTHKPVKALETDIVTIVDGREESRSTVPAGHWLIRNPKGEQYYNDPDTFRQRYIPVSPED